ncbi:aspartate aminotransferase, partial [human gut metagenome]
MARHARLLRPKFEQVISIFREELDGSGIASWTEPRGGYFLSFDTMPGCAARTVELCRRAGVKFTPAGSTWPYGRDPQD